MSDQPRENNRATYRVVAAGLPTPKPPRAPRARGPAAVLVAHGMGQQIPFETLEIVAEGLLNNSAHKHRGPKPIAKTVEVGGQRLQRLELHVGVDEATTREVHVYEAYWAPFTEGQVKLRDVMGFLLRGAVGGIQLGMREFHRWIFDRYVRFPAPVRAVLYLLLALAVVVALVFLNSVIVAMAAARAPLQSPPPWLSNALFQDVTSVLNGLVCTLLPFALVLGWATLRRRRRKPAGVGWLSIVTFIFALWAIMAAAILIAAAVAFHAKLPPADTTSLFGAMWGARALAFDRGFDTVAALILVGSVAFMLVRWLWTLAVEIADVVHQSKATRPLTIWVLAGTTLLLGSLIGGAIWLLRTRLSVGSAPWMHGIAWPAIIGVAAFVRSFLIQYAGDVAAYVQPQVVDRFYELRQKIKDCVWKTAKAIYSDSEYQDVILVGHSLGSVVVYDVLNRLILDHKLAGGEAPEVVSRTRLLLTFGSPLDKTAFIFGTQGSGQEAREALAASVQPLITEESVRPRWINIWSPWDIISGHLDYYDLPETWHSRNRNPIDNIQDEAATTLLAAHVEYWSNPLVFKPILAHLA